MDTETDDPLLLDRGPSWVFGQGEVIVTGLYDAQKQEKKSIDGAGGAVMKKLLLSSSSAMVGANIGYDIGWLCYAHGLKPQEIKAQLIDVSVAESLIDEYQLYSLDKLAQKYLKERKGHEELEAIAAGLGLKGDFRKHLKHLWHADNGVYRPKIRAYVISDADQPVRIWEKQLKILEEQELLSAFWLNMGMVKITLGMKQRGVRIDHKKWKENSEIAAKIQEQLKNDFTSKYTETNLRSPLQMKRLFDEQRVPYKHKIVFKGWQVEGRRFKNETDAFTGDQVWDQRSRLKESFPNVRVSKGKIILMVPSQYAERTASQARDMGYEVSNNPSINKFTFLATKETHKVVADIVELKQVSNIVDKFLGPNFERFLVYHEATKQWRLHGDFNPVGARQTGRMSASHPNLQNIPSKTMLFTQLFELPKALRELCKDIFVPAKMDGDKIVPGGINLAHMCREVFLAEVGHAAVKLDFNGQENRLQAHFAVGANGNRIRAMYHENPRLDEHQFVADASGLQEKHGKKNGRKYAKNVRFGLGYGMQITTMCEQFGWDKEFAQELIDAVKDASPWVPETMEAIQSLLLKKRRWIKTLIGRRIHLQAGKDRDAYKFYNYLIQGSAADMLKLCIVAMATDGVIDTEEAVGYLLLLVHDEAVFSVPKTRAGAKFVLTLQQYMQETAELLVPVICDPEIGENWADTEAQETDKDTGEFTETVSELIDRMFKGAKAAMATKTGMTKKLAMVIDKDDDDFVDFMLDGEDTEEDDDD
jgi:DNA polymerase I-like protein with 3'-5' exonuclease and polymerase domains